MLTAAERLEAVEAEIARACTVSGRSRADVTLVAVSKGHPAASLQTMYDLGVRHFGESRLQEALPKIAALPNDVRWHFVGTLQTNKARRIADQFHLIHTVAKEEHLREMGKSGRKVAALVEVNIGSEPQKVGVPPEQLNEFLENVLQYGCVQIHGLMGIGRAGLSDEEKREEFRLLSNLASRFSLPLLSMGMSDDYAAAIQEGATHIRVGTALFGGRPPGPSPVVDRG